MTWIVMAMHGMFGWLHGFEDGVAICATVFAIAITGALGRAGRRMW